MKTSLRLIIYISGCIVSGSGFKSRELDRHSRAGDASRASVLGKSVC
jgi:hypothetical protein